MSQFAQEVQAEPGRSQSCYSVALGAAFRNMRADAETEESGPELNLPMPKLKCSFLRAVVFATI